MQHPENFLGGTKGDVNDTWTEDEMNAMIESGTWNGGYVDAFSGYAGKGNVGDDVSGSEPDYGDTGSETGWWSEDNL